MHSGGWIRRGARRRGWGRSSYRIARDLYWPIVRPRAARAAAIVFVLAMVEPAQPLILGLRRTLAFQIVDAAASSAVFPRRPSGD